MTQVVIIDYGMGNLWSVQSAFAELGAQARLSSDPAVVESASCLVLPGVGSFRKAMEHLRQRQLDVALKAAMSRPDTKLLGICLGMQLLADSGTEDGRTEGLGFIEGRVEALSQHVPNGLKVPHIGFNSVAAPASGRLFQGVAPQSDFYFVHSFHVVPSAYAERFGYVHYGVDLAATYEDGRVFATQFHPEKSQTNGLSLLKNFLAA